MRLMIRTLRRDVAKPVWIALASLVLAPLLAQLPSLVTGLSSNPLWSQSGAVIVSPNQILGGWAFGDPNVGWTSQALGHLAATDWLHGRIPWWNPYSGIGLPLAGEMQPAALFLPFILLLALQNGMLWLELSMQIFAGLATLALLRRMKFGWTASLLGALLYQFNGTFQVVPGETILNVLPFLPLLLLGIETACDAASGRAAIILIALAIGGSILAGFPEAAYIDGLMALGWALARLYGNDRKTVFARRILIGGLLGLMLSSPQIVAFADFTAASNIIAHHRLGGIVIDIRALASVIIPYIYGNLGSGFGSPLLFSVSGAAIGYAGAVIVLFATLGLLAPQDRPIALMLIGWTLLCAGKIFGIPPIAEIVNLIPLMRETMFFRYASPSGELALIILAVRGFDQPRPFRRRLIASLALTAGFIALAIGLAWPWSPVWHLAPTGRASLIQWQKGAVAFQIAAIVLVTTLWLARRRHLAGTTIALYAMAMTTIPQLSGQWPGTIDRPAIDFLKSHLGLQRFYTLGPIQPNYAAYFRIASINDNYLPVALNWAQYVEHHLLPAAASQNGGILWALFPPMNVSDATTALDRFAPNYRFLGVRYIVTPPGDQLSPSVTLPPNSTGSIARTLARGSSLIWTSQAPASFAHLGRVAAIALFQSNFGHTANGSLSIVLCAGHDCVNGSRNLARSTDNSMFRIRLDHPLAIDPGDKLKLTVTHATGYNAEALWLPPETSNTSTLATATGKRLTGRTLQIAFDAETRGTNVHQVYRDRIMTIWRQHDADPYYTTSGSTCTLSNQYRDAVTATCGGNARLIRRVLFMPGWHATVNGHPAAITPDHGIVQAIDLKPGRNTIAYHFEPPFEPVASALFWLAVTILAALASGIGKRASFAIAA